MKTHKLSKLAYLSIVIILGASTNAMAQSGYGQSHRYNDDLFYRYGTQVNGRDHDVWTGSAAWTELGRPQDDPRNYPKDPRARAAIQIITSEELKQIEDRVNAGQQLNQQVRLREEQERARNLDPDFKENLLKARKRLDGYKVVVNSLNFDHLLEILKDGRNVELNGITNLTAARTAINSQLTYLQHELDNIIDGTVRVQHKDQTIQTIQQILNRENTILRKLNTFFSKAHGYKALQAVVAATLSIVAGASQAASVDSFNQAPLNSQTKPNNFSNKSWASPGSDGTSAR